MGAGRSKRKEVRATKPNSCGPIARCLPNYLCRWYGVIPLWCRHSEPLRRLVRNTDSSDKWVCCHDECIWGDLRRALVFSRRAAADEYDRRLRLFSGDFRYILPIGRQPIGAHELAEAIWLSGAATPGSVLCVNWGRRAFFVEDPGTFLSAIATFHSRAPDQWGVRDESVRRASLPLILYGLRASFYPLIRVSENLDAQSLIARGG